MSQANFPKSSISPAKFKIDNNNNWFNVHTINTTVDCDNQICLKQAYKWLNNNSEIDANGLIIKTNSKANRTFADLIFVFMILWFFFTTPLGLILGIYFKNKSINTILLIISITYLCSAFYLLIPIHDFYMFPSNDNYLANLNTTSIWYKPYFLYRCKDFNCNYCIRNACNWIQYNVIGIYLDEHPMQIMKRSSLWVNT